jgi:tight adherence protein B
VSSLVGTADPRRAAAVAGMLVALVAGPVIGVGAVLPFGLASGEAVRRALVGKRQRDASALRDEIAAWCAALASELTAGRVPDAALAAATEATAPALRTLVAPVTAVAALGGDVPASLRECAVRPGATALRHVAACWEVAAGAGAGLSVALQRLSAGLRVAERLRGEVASQLASARATARLLAALPLFGLLLGSSLGARPWHFLLYTRAGAACAAAAVVLNVIGLAWTDRIADRVPVP